MGERGGVIVRREEPPIFFFGVPTGEDSESDTTRLLFLRLTLELEAEMTSWKALLLDRRSGEDGNGWLMVFLTIVLVY